MLSTSKASAVQPYDYLFKVILIGDQAVGKTNLLLRHVDDHFNGDAKATIGVDFLPHTLRIDDEYCKLLYWDTAGAERFRAMTNTCYRNANGAIVVYDITNYITFLNVQKWIDEFRFYTNNEATVILLIDLKDNRAVPTSEAERFARENGFLFIALDSTNVADAFETITREMIALSKSGRPVPQQPESIVTLPGPPPPPPKRSCC